MVTARRGWIGRDGLCVKDERGSLTGGRSTRSYHSARGEAEVFLVHIRDEEGGTKLIDSLVPVHSLVPGSTRRASSPGHQTQGSSNSMNSPCTASSPPPSLTIRTTYRFPGFPRPRTPSPSQPVSTPSQTGLNLLKSPKPRFTAPNRESSTFPLAEVSCAARIPSR